MGLPKGGGVVWGEPFEVARLLFSSASVYGRVSSSEALLPELLYAVMSKPKGPWRKEVAVGYQTVRAQKGIRPHP